jgi:hypothetical protein
MKEVSFSLLAYISIAISLVTITQLLSSVTLPTAAAEGSEAISEPISAIFNEAMDGATLTTDTFTVKDWDGNNVAGTISLSEDGRTATFIPSESLQGSVDYTATITREAKDRAGNYLTAEKIWSFSIPDDTQNQEQQGNIEEIKSAASNQQQSLQPFSAEAMPLAPSSSSPDSINGSDTNTAIPTTTITSPSSEVIGDTQYIQPQQSQQQQPLSPFTTLIQDIIPPETVISSVIDGNNIPLLQTAITDSGLQQPYSPYATAPLALPGQTPTPPLTSNTGVTTSNSITIAFTGADNDGTNTVSEFECRHAGSIEFTPCTNPTVLQDLAPGSMNVFEVRAVDAAGNRDFSPAMFSWIAGVQSLLAQQPLQQQPLQQQPLQQEHLLQQQSVLQPPILGTEPLATTAPTLQQ